MGLPVITLEGEAFAGRMAASLLRSSGLSELVTSSRPDYENLAVSLAKNPQRLDRLRRKLIDEKTSSPLFDLPRFTKHLEESFLRMVSLYRSGLPPEDIHIPNDA